MKFLKDLLFPKVCLSCGFLGSHICLNCQQNLRKIDKDTCFYCKRPSFLGLTHPPCKKKYGVDGFLACFYYNDVLKKIIKNIKYRLTREGLHELLLLFPEGVLDKLARYNKLYKNISVESIPLHRARQNQRGFNQSEEIARFITSSFSFPRAQNLIRTRNTPPQSQQSKSADRRQNIRNAFDLQPHHVFISKEILLVDDVVTTGATISEASQVLKRHGARKVLVFTLAKG